MIKSGSSVTVAWDTSSIQEWFNPTIPLNIKIINPELANKFRKHYIKGFIKPASNNLYIGCFIGRLLFGVLGFSNPTYGDYDILMKADTTPSDWLKSTDLLLFTLRSKEVKTILENKFCREINTIYSMCFSEHPSIQRYKKHATLIQKKVIRTNKTSAEESIKRKANNKVNNEIKSGRLIKQPYEVCRDINTEAHHKDYTKPLEINWLCVKHHNERDGEDETCYKIVGYNLGYLFKAGSICSLKEAKAQFIQKSWIK